ncbi:MAG: hypothetical protein HC855_13430 [Rhizobiales bacterium]|nr:hypothetical protein [Hyphomicrobiales bacterium]
MSMGASPGLCAAGFYTSGQCGDIGEYSNTSSDLYRGDYHFEGKDEVETRGASATTSATSRAASPAISRNS